MIVIIPLWTFPQANRVLHIVSSPEMLADCEINQSQSTHTQVHNAQGGDTY